MQSTTHFLQVPPSTHHIIYLGTFIATLLRHPVFIFLLNTYFKKKDKHRVTYKNGDKSTQVDYVMCRRKNLKEMCDCKGILNECVAKQYRMVVCKMALMVKKKKAEKVKPKIDGGN